MIRFEHVLALFLGLMLTSAVEAQQTVYTYVGQNFTQTSGTWTSCVGTAPECAGGVVPPTRITGSLTFPSPLAPNLTFETLCLPGNPYCPTGSWSISDGLHSFNASSSACSDVYGPVYLATDANGQIAYWAFRVICHITISGVTYDEDLQTAYYPPGYTGSGSGPFVADATSESYVLNSNRIYTAVAQNNTSTFPNALPGQWTKSSTPPTPTQAILSLTTLLSSPTLGLSPTTIITLTDKLDAALQSIARGNKTAATNQLSAFIRQVQSLARDGLLTSANAALLIAKANAIIDSL